MEQELERVEAEFDALDDASDMPEADRDTSSGDDGPWADDVDVASDAAGKWTSDDSADMLDEEDFPPRSASQALVDAKLEQVAALRATEAYDEARRLLYEVLAEGDETQVRVARNILQQMDG